MRKFREWARAFVYLDFLFTLAWYLALATFSLIILIIVIIRGEYDQLPTRNRSQTVQD